MFLPNKQMKEIWNKVNGEEVFLTTRDGVKLNGYYVNNKSEKTILFFHGNAANISFLEERILVAKDLGYNIFVFDYRGYGKSEGAITKESDTYTDGEAAYEYVLWRAGWNSRNILLWGQSLGGAIAIHTAEGKELAGLIVESSFFSMDAMAQYQYPYIPTRLLLQYHFRSDEALQQVKTKTLIFHSRTDEVIPFTNGEQLFATANSPKQFVETHGSHNGWFLESRELIVSEIKKFFE